MDKAVWTEREQAERALAQGATTSEARLIHLELARRYGLAAGSRPPTDASGPEPETVQPEAAAPHAGSIFRPLPPVGPDIAEPDGPGR